MIVTVVMMYKKNTYIQCTLNINTTNNKSYITVYTYIYIYSYICITIYHNDHSNHDNDDSPGPSHTGGPWSHWKRATQQHENIKHNKRNEIANS